MSVYYQRPSRGRTPTLRPDFHRDRPDSESGWLH